MTISEGEFEGKRGDYWQYKNPRERDLDKCVTYVKIHQTVYLRFLDLCTLNKPQEKNKIKKLKNTSKRLMIKGITGGC